MSEDPRVEAVEAILIEASGLRRGDYLDGELASLRDLSAKLLAAADAAAWRPIATAPKDMTRVDLWHEKFGRVTGAFWKTGRWCTNQGAKPRSGIDNAINYQDRITHFMPRPSPPQEQDT